MSERARETNKEREKKGVNKKKVNLQERRERAPCSFSLELYPLIFILEFQLVAL
jgi:hypothetical protein